MHALRRQRSKLLVQYCQQLLLDNLIIAPSTSNTTAVETAPSNTSPDSDYPYVDLRIVLGSKGLEHDSDCLAISNAEADDIDLDSEDCDHTANMHAIRNPPRSMSSLGGESMYMHSTASTPSFRAAPNPFDIRPLQPPTDQDSANVKVVVRVRQFVPREIEARSPCIISMDPCDQSTTLHAPNQGVCTPGSRSRQLEEKNFTFDKSFWSHKQTDSHYATQEDVYRSFGEEFLSHNFDGFHTCIFAYGQTGSGKSYTMMGGKDNPGLIPRTCEALFARIKEEPEPNTTYNVHVSYFEVYNEHVRDLLVPKIFKDGPPSYLKIRESPQEGVYVQGLTDAPVKSFADVERLMAIGDSNRTTAATKMNDTSSRSHAVFTIQLKQIQHSLTQDETIERTARMRLVDLAGSERANKTEATGQRLVEGGKINKSLTTLGRVIAALADPRRQALGPQNGRNSPRPGTPQSRNTRSGPLSLRGQPPLEVVPYRDSVLTWLLKDSLGGNSKTAMVACISPTDYDETLSTLRYADQAKRIQTRAHANIDAVSAAERDAQINTLQTTIQALQASLNTASVRKKEEASELEDYQKQVMAMQRLMEEARQVSEARIRALTAEVEELRPQNERLKNEGEALKRHVRLLAGEIKNPIIIPEEYVQSVAASLMNSMVDAGAHRSVTFEDEEEAISPLSDDSTLGLEDSEAHNRDIPDIGSGQVPYTAKEEEAIHVHAEAQELLEQLKLFRRKARSDMERFPMGRSAAAVY